MALFDIPVSIGDPFYEVETDLDGVAFRLEFKFNERSEAWYMNVFDTSNNLLRAGIKIVNEFPLLRLWADVEQRPAGNMFTVIRGDSVEPAKIDELGDDILLVYSGDS